MIAMEDHYIPLRPADLVQKLGDEPSVTIFEREQFQALCELLDATIHHEYRSRLTRLNADYAPFDPDDGAAAFEQLSNAERGTRAQGLFEEFDALLMRANYRKLTREEIEAAIQSPSQNGLRLHLDLNLFEHLEIYARGSCELERHTRSWRTAWNHDKQIVLAFRRLAIILRLRERSPLTDPLDARVVILKLFKDIPREDIETLLPGGRIRMGLYEQAQIFVPTISGVGLTLFKLLKGAAAVAFASVYGLIGFLGLVSGAIGYACRSFHGYLRTKEKHQLNLTRSLYFQNLDNNSGVIYHLLAEAEEQEFREIVLAWWLLWRGGLSGSTAQQIDAAAEQWLQRRCNIEADFEIGDALDKLFRLRLAFPTNGRWRAVAIEEALEALNRNWDDQFTSRVPTEVIKPRIWRAAA
jgi:hypothetical protein